MGCNTRPEEPGSFSLLPGAAVSTFSCARRVCVCRRERCMARRRWITLAHRTLASSNTACMALSRRPTCGLDALLSTTCAGDGVGMNGIQRALEGMMVLSSQGVLASVDHVRQPEGAGVSSFTVKRKSTQVRVCSARGCALPVPDSGHAPRALLPHSFFRVAVERRPVVPHSSVPALEVIALSPLLSPPLPP